MTDRYPEHIAYSVVPNPELCRPAVIVLATVPKHCWPLERNRRRENDSCKRILLLNKRMTDNYPELIEYSRVLNPGLCKPEAIFLVVCDRSTNKL